MSELIEEPIEAPVDEQPAETAPVEPTDEQVAPEPSPEFDPREIQAELEHLRGQNAQLVQWAQQQGASPQQAQQYATEQTGFDPSRLNPLEDDFGQNLVEFMSQRDKGLIEQMQQIVSQVTQPIQQQEEARVIAEGEQQMKDVISDVATREGELQGGDAAMNRIIDSVRNKHFPEVAERYGMSNRAAEIAIERAYREEAAYQKSIGEAAVAAHVNRNATLAGQRAEIGSSAVTGVSTTPSEILPPGALARKYSADAARLRNT